MGHSVARAHFLWEGSFLGLQHLISLVAAVQLLQASPRSSSGLTFSVPSGTATGLSQAWPLRMTLEGLCQEYT